MSKSWKRRSSRWDDEEGESERRFRDKKNINKKNRQNKHKREMSDPTEPHKEVIEQSTKRWFSHER